MLIFVFHHYKWKPFTKMSKWLFPVSANTQQLRHRTQAGQSNSTPQVKGRVQFSFLAQPLNHPSSVSSHLKACFLNVKYILCYLPHNHAKCFGGEWVLVWGLIFLELFPVLHPNLYPTDPKRHLKNPHIHRLGPFCWGAVSQWLLFFMLAVHQIKTQTIDEECELMGREVNQLLLN